MFTFFILVIITALWSIANVNYNNTEDWKYYRQRNGYLLSFITASAGSFFGIAGFGDAIAGTVPGAIIGYFVGDYFVLRHREKNKSNLVNRFVEKYPINIIYTQQLTMGEYLINMLIVIWVFLIFVAILAWKVTVWLLAVAFAFFGSLAIVLLNTFLLIKIFELNYIIKHAIDHEGLFIGYLLIISIIIISLIKNIFAEYWTLDMGNMINGLVKTIKETFNEPGMSPAFEYANGLILGENGEKNIDEGLRILGELANRGDRVAQSKLSYYYFGKDGVSKNAELCYFWAEKSAEQNDPNGVFYLAFCYKTGVGVKKNYEKAYRFFVQAKSLFIQEENDWMTGQTQYNIGTLYEHGLGREQDEKKALWWYECAKANGYQEAIKKIEILNSTTKIN